MPTYAYDGQDRLAMTNFPVTTQGANSSNTGDYEQLSYDANSHVTVRRLRDGSTIGFTYDNLGRITARTPSGENTVNYQYDLLSRPTLLQRPGDGANVTLAWDVLGRQLSEVQSFGSASYQYDTAGRRTRLTWGDGIFVTYDYDTVGNVTAIRENGAASGIGVLASYAYDSLGRRTSIAYGNGTNRNYAYDSLSRLAGLQLDAAGTANDQFIGAVGGVGAAITYNPASQNTGITKSNSAYVWTGAANVSRPYVTNGLNQYTASGSTGFGYDARGNLTASGTSAFTYSKLNELKSTPGVTMYYDPLGRLMEYDTSTSTRMVYSGGALIAEVANPSGTVLRRYVPGPGVDEPVVWYEGPGTSDRRFLQGDERGSIVLVTDGSGSALAINRYDEFGIPQTGNAGRFGYTGQAWFPEAGLYNYKARWYSPTMGRFMQTDPIGYADGLNWYDYAHGDPVNGSDPTGLYQKCFGSCSAGGGGNNIPYENLSGLPAKDNANYDDRGITITGQKISLFLLSAQAQGVFATITLSFHASSTTSSFDNIGGMRQNGGPAASPQNDKPEPKTKAQCALEALNENKAGLALDFLAGVANAALPEGSAAVAIVGSVIGVTGIAVATHDRDVAAGGIAYAGKQAAAAEGLLRGAGSALGHRIGVRALIASTAYDAAKTVAAYNKCMSGD